MRKSISFKTPNKRPSPNAQASADDWVEQRATGSGATKRFTIDVPLEMHRRIKMACALRGENMAEMMRALLNREFPETSDAEFSGGDRK